MPRVLASLTVALAVTGVVAVGAASRAAPPTVSSVGAVTPAMNFAYVRMSGAVVDFPVLEPDGSYLAFRLRDATGEIRVQAYRSVATAARSPGAAPAPGDRATVEGTLRIRDGEASLVLNTPEALTLERPDPGLGELSALAGLEEGARVVVRAQVRRVRDVGPRRIITLRSGAFDADAVVALDVPGGAPALGPGDWVQLTGGVGEYRGRKELLVMPDQIMPAAAPALATRPPGAISRDLEGQWAVVAGRVARLAPFRGGMRAFVAGVDGAEVAVTLFDSVWNGVPFSATLRAGDALAAAGRVLEYRGALEVQPEIVADVWREP